MEIERLNVTSKFMDSLKKFSDDQFTWGTLRHLINALKDHGVPSDTVDRLRIIVENIDVPEEDRRIIMYDGQEIFGRAKYFEGIDKPLFCFSDDNLNYHHSEVKQKGDATRSILRFRLSLSVKYNRICLSIGERQVTQKIREAISEAWVTFAQKTGYSGGTIGTVLIQETDSDTSIDVLFWRPEPAVAFVEYLNKNYEFD